MYDNTTTHEELLEPSLPGSWIAKHRRIWQMDFLSASELANFVHKRGLASYDEEDITQLWQLGLLKADLITSSKKLHLVGLVDRGIDRYGEHIYSDERQFPRKLRKWNNARENLKPLQKGIQLLFHPFRYYIFYHLNRILGLNISKMQMLYQEGFPRVLDYSLSSFNRWAESGQYRESIRKWNNIASLCILTEPCLYERVFHLPVQSSQYDVEDYQTGEEEIRQQIEDYWQDNIKNLYHQIGIERLEEIRQHLCGELRAIDENEWIHTLLCLGSSKLRLELEGYLGGTLLLRTMTEMLRRAMEKIFDKELPEEDELGSEPYGFKKRYYGSDRLLDDAQARGYFIRRHGLNYTSHVHLYVEGHTEYGALKSFFKNIGIPVPIVNLHGFVKEGTSNRDNPMVTFFSESLQTDIQNQVYSVVVIDGDVPENVKILESAAKRNNASKDKGIFGRFFLSPDQDFEFANFEVEELEEVLWRWLGEEESPSQVEREQLHNHVKNTTKSSTFFKGVKQFAVSFPQLVGYEKGEMWGEKLIEFALEHPFKKNRKRKVLEIIDTIVYWETTIELERYDEVREKNTVDSHTGELIERTS